jgi:hypothetical protein
MLSPDHADPFADKTPAPGTRTYKDAIVEVKLAQERKVRAVVKNLFHEVRVSPIPIY